ncbi:hypothetical protein GCM10017691_20340 [Pseudonocardia petroleophila]|uniref:Glycosyl transferase family 2 n=1 Tax=Pseudonocardia petroleophila TaxID=37331 RepID=A0A7G7MGR3_9PSEU|nr:hypothetical protein [Pseudonocardia petroleophila]QNG51974.1 hypothetical protein H6H00_28480 [Pseudonocardia petroleophila]
MISNKAAPPLRIVYRSAEAENTKPRPTYYSKTLALVSLLRAAAALPVPPEIVFLNDGDIPGDRLALMEAHGTVRAIDGGSNRTTFRVAVARQAALATDTDDLVWFAEDDYLYSPHAFTSLLAAASSFPCAHYFSLYGSDALDPSAPGRRPTRRPEPGAVLDPEARTAGAATWYRAYATTSTFAVRSRILREDAALLRLMPFIGGAWDTATCLTYQGYLPFGVTDLLPDGTTSALRAIPRGLARTVIGLRSLRRPSRRRVQLGADPELISHMETADPTTRSVSAKTEAVDWQQLAVDTMFWAADRGIPVPIGSGPPVTAQPRGRRAHGVEHRAEGHPPVSPS